MEFKVKTDIYDGPLPLLVELAKADLIDLFIIKLVDLTGQYLDQVLAEQTDIDFLSEPLPLLGRLLAIKARNLMPRPDMPEDEEEVPISLEELERRLKEYEQFKSVAQLLSELQQLQSRHFSRPTENPMAADVDAPKKQESFVVGVADLISAFSQVLERSTAAVYEVRGEAWTVEMKTAELGRLLKARRRMRFFDIFTPEKSRLELVVTFLALLELIRQHVIQAVQSALFSDIEIVAVDPSDESAGNPETAG